MNSERMERARAFFRILENHDIYSVSCKINISELKRAMTRIWALGRSFHWGPYDKPFIVTFRVLMDYLHDRRELFPSLPREEKIDFIFDNQSEKGVIYSVWDDYLRSKSPHSRNLYGSTPRFEDDNDLLGAALDDGFEGVVELLGGLADGEAAVNFERVDAVIFADSDFHGQTFGHGRVSLTD